MNSFAIFPEAFNILIFLRNANQWYSWNRKDLKTLWSLGLNCLKDTEPLEGDSLLFTDRFLEEGVWSKI